MRHMTLALVKKRWYIFLVLAVLTLLMNVVVWNNTSQLLRKLSTLQILKDKSEGVASHYEIIYIENAGKDGRIIPNSDEEYGQFYSLFLDAFYDQSGEGVLYSNKANYIFKDEELSPFTKEQLKERLSNLTGVRDPGYVIGKALSDLMLINDRGLDLGSLSNQLAGYNFDVTFRTLRESYQGMYDYYFGAMRFAILVYLILLMFSLLLIYWLISTSLKISRPDTRLLRIVGLPRKRLSRHYTVLFSSMIVLGFVGAITFANSLGFGVLFIDYLYLIGLNSLFILIVWAVTSRKIRRLLDT